MLYLGIDYHRDYSHIAVKDKDGNEVINTKILNDKMVLNCFLEELAQPTKATVEAGRTSFVIYDLLTDLGVDVLMADPLKTRAIAEARIKTDTIDARTLADLLRANLIPEVYVPAKEIRQIKDILRQRIFLVRLSTMIKGRIRQLVDRNHLEIPKNTKGKSIDLFGKIGLSFLKKVPLVENEQKLLQMDIELLSFIQEKIRQTEELIEENLKDSFNYQVLLSVPGFGKILAAIVALEIDTVERFSRVGKLLSYSGLCPSTFASGGKVFHGRILKSCNRYLKFAFIEAAWCAVRYSPYFQAYFNRMVRKKGPQKAIVCLAKKLCIIVYKVLKEKRLYQERVYRPAAFSQV